ncbi:MAG: DNA-binding protein [Schaedlerella sp.]|uniref:DNA-binding protein n=1 Tax=Schaedlerella sp. TaxID=2676057 RepID=UPI00265E4F5C|nr:DNA-binding protein [uncultured Schaedlerella sp.]
MFDYISVRDAAKKWCISERRVQKLCEEKRIEGVIRFGHSWMIPKLSSKPVDLRRKNSKIPSDEKNDI